MDGVGVTVGGRGVVASLVVMACRGLLGGGKVGGRVGGVVGRTAVVLMTVSTTVSIATGAGGVGSFVWQAAKMSRREAIYKCLVVMGDQVLRGWV